MHNTVHSHISRDCPTSIVLTCPTSRFVSSQMSVDLSIGEEIMFCIRNHVNAAPEKMREVGFGTEMTKHSEF